MPSINNATNLTQPLPIVRAAVQVRATWSEPWVYVPYLRPTSCTSACAPEIPSADLIYRFGDIKRSDQTGFGAYGPLDLAGYYCRIILLTGYGLTPCWTGTIVEQQTSLVGARAEGEQHFRAYGLAHLLDQITIHKSYAWDRDEIQELEWTPRFNARHRRGDFLLGNRSIASKDVGGAYKVDVFDRARFFDGLGVRWNNRSIAMHLLVTHSPAAFTPSFAGQHEPLTEIFELHDFEGETLWRALCRLIDRRRGIGFFIEDDAENNVYLHCFSVSDRPIAVGESSLPANANPLTFFMPTQYPATHLLADVVIRKSDQARVNEIIVQGERIRVAATFSLEDGTLEPAWSDDLEADYLVAVDDETPRENDRYRAGDKFEGVFTRFRVPMDWDGQVGDGAGGETENVWLKAKESGEIEFADVSGFWRYDKPFERELPFEVGIRYDEEEPVDENLEDASPEFRPLAVWIRHQTYDEDYAIIAPGGGGGGGEAKAKWLYVDRLGEVDQKLPSVHVRPLDKDLGFELTVSPRHFFAEGHWDDAAASRREPKFDYEDLVCTASFRLDARMRLVLRRGGGGSSGIESDAATRVVITVSGCELWYAPPSCVFDIDEDGQPIRVHEERRLLRSDADKLTAAAAQAAAWYGVPRLAIQIPIKRVGLFAPLGAMLVGIDSVYRFEEVRAPITGRHIDFTQGATTLETSFVALDFSRQT